MVSKQDKENARAVLEERNGRGRITRLRASDVVTKPVEWLWFGRVPFGKLALFDGDPDQGKSVVTVDIAARVSTGRGFADGSTCEPGNVVICNVEDAADDTIVPRLKAAGADLERIVLFSSVEEGNGDKRLLELPRDVPLVEELVKEEDAALLILDPVMTLLGGDVNKDQDARKALTPVADMAERTGVATVGVRHLNKSVGLKAIQRGGGNMGLIGVARAGSYFADHPDDDTLKVMAPHKSNLAEKQPALAYRIVSSPVRNTARIEWTGATDHDANSLASDASTPHEKSVLDEAKEFLAEELSDGPMWAKQVYKDARDAGISDASLRRAKAVLKVRSEKIGADGWQWSLPSKGSEDDQRQKVEHVEHLQDSNESSPPYYLYIKEDAQGAQGAQGELPEHVHAHLPEGDEATNGYSGHPLTLEEQTAIERLMYHGMSRKWATAEVLGERS